MAETMSAEERASLIINEYMMGGMDAAHLTECIEIAIRGAEFEAEAAAYERGAAEMNEKCAHFSEENNDEHAELDGWQVAERIRALLPSPDSGGEVPVCKLCDDTGFLWFRNEREPSHEPCPICEQKRFGTPSPDIAEQLATALQEAKETLAHASIFIRSREKMHSTGVSLYDEACMKVLEALVVYERSKGAG